MLCCAGGRDQSIDRGFRFTGLGWVEEGGFVCKGYEYVLSGLG